MAVDDKWDDPKYTGFSKYFNSYTIRGRSNWAKLWISVYAVSYLTYRLVRKSSSNTPDTAGPPAVYLTDSSAASKPSIVENSGLIEKSPVIENSPATENSPSVDNSPLVENSPPIGELEMHQPPNEPSNDPALKPGARMSGPVPTPQQPCYPPPPCYPCYPYFFYPPPFQDPNQFAPKNFFPPCPYPYYPYPAPPSQTPQNSPENSSSSIQNQPQLNTYYTPQNQTSPSCPNFSPQSFYQPEPKSPCNAPPKPTSPKCHHHQPPSSNQCPTESSNIKEYNSLPSESSTNFPIDPSPSSLHDIKSEGYVPPEYINKKHNN